MSEMLRPVLSPVLRPVLHPPFKYVSRDRRGLKLDQQFRLDAGSSMADAALVGPTLSFNRAGVGWYFNESGVLVSAASHLPRFNHDPVTGAPLGLLLEPERTNRIQNNTMVGASAGTPGTLPPRWVDILQGMSREVVGTGTTNGIEWIDLRLYGTPSSAPYIGFEGNTGINALNGQDWAISSHLALVGGDLSEISTIRLWHVTRTSAGGFIATMLGPDFKDSLTSTMQRFDFAATLMGGGTVAKVQPVLGIQNAGGAIDITLRFGIPGEEKGAYATSPIKTTNAGVVKRNKESAWTYDVSWFNRTEGTFVVGFSRPAYTFNEPILAAQVNTVLGSGIEINAFTGGSRVDYGRASGQDTLNIGVSPVADQDHKFAFAYAVDDLQTAGDGALGDSDNDTAGELVDAGLNVLNVGGGEGITRTETTHLQFIQYLNVRKPNGFLSRITA